MLFDDISKSEESTPVTGSLNVTRNVISSELVNSSVGSNFVNDTTVGDVISTVYDSLTAGVVLVNALGMSVTSTIS